MAQKAIIINTPKKPLQSDAQDWASLFSSIIGEGSGVLDYGNKLQVTKKNNNTVTVKDGVYSMQGHIIKIDKGTTIDLTVDSGTLGVDRIDSVIIEYSKNINPANDDDFVIKLLKGTPKPSGGSPAVAPSLVTNDLLQGGLKRQEVIFNVLIIGTNLSIVDKRVFVKGVKGLEEKINQDLTRELGIIKNIEESSVTTFKNGWTPFYSVVLTKDSHNRIEMVGGITGGTTKEGTTLLQLPSGFEPYARTVNASAWSDNAGVGTAIPIRIEITGTGEVKIHTSSLPAKTYIGFLITYMGK